MYTLRTVYMDENRRTTEVTNCFLGKSYNKLYTDSPNFVDNLKYIADTEEHLSDLKSEVYIILSAGESTHLISQDFTSDVIKEHYIVHESGKTFEKL